MTVTAQGSVLLVDNAKCYSTSSVCVQTAGSNDLVVGLHQVTLYYRESQSGSPK